MLEITLSIVKWQVLWLVVFFGAIYIFNLKVLLPFLQHGMKDRSKVIMILQSEARHIEEEVTALESQLDTLTQNVAENAKSIVQSATQEASIMLANKAAELNKKMLDSIEFSLRNAQEMQKGLENSLGSLIDATSTQVVELILGQFSGKKQQESQGG